MGFTSNLGPLKIAAQNLPLNQSANQPKLPINELKKTNITSLLLHILAFKSQLNRHF